MKLQRTWIGIVPAVAAAALLAAGCAGEPHGRRGVDELPALPVDVAVVEAAPWGGGFEVTAGVQPVRRAMPGTVLMGRVEQVLVHEGDRVRAGQPLARIASRDVAARVAQAEAEVTASEAFEKNAKRMLERMERLHERQAASQRDLDDARAGWTAADSRLTAAREGVVAANAMLDYSTVAAPFAGWVVDKRVEAGDLAAPGMPLFVIEDQSRLKVEAPVAESVARALSPGDPVEVEVGGARLAARIDEILPAADPKSRTVTVRAVIDNADRGLRSGEFARLRLSVPGDGAGPAQAAPSVPDAAIVRHGPLTGVFVIEGDPARARLRWITLGRVRDGRHEVLTGLAPGERYVAAPGPDLEDGRRVEVRG